MNDSIYRQAAIDAAMKEVSDKRTHDFNAGVTRAANNIKTLPSAQQWIPCSERLPEVSGRYLVTRGLKAAGAIWNRVYIANFSDLMGLKDHRIFWDGNVGKSDFVRLDDVISWMPLPEPYKEATL